MGIFGDASTINIAGLFVSIASVVFQVIGLATPFWINVTAGPVSVHSGLWQVCESSTCVTLPSCSGGDLCSQFKGAQAMETLAFINFLFAVVLIVLKMFVMKDRIVLKKCGGIICVVGGIFALVGVILFATLDTTEVAYLHFSFAFCVIAAVGGIAGGIMSIL